MKPLRLLTLLLACSFLTACASATRAPRFPQEMPDSGWLEPRLGVASKRRSVALEITREVGWVGRSMGTLLLVDGQPVAFPGRGQHLKLFLAPGVHRLAIGYAKHPDSRPLWQQDVDLGDGRDRRYSLRLRIGELPSFEPLDGATPARFAVDACPLDAPASLACDARSNLRVVDDKVCAMACANASAPPGTGWQDLGNLEEYVEVHEIAGIVDAAVRAAGLADRLRGSVGRHIPEHRRYIYTRQRGWVDIKHVVSTTSNALLYLPGGSMLGAFGVEVAQSVVAPMSAFLAEDHLSNAIGARAAWRSLASGGRRTRGQIAQQMIEELQPLDRSQALRHFGIEP